MSNVQAAIQVANQLISKVFNHRQFTTGEINYLISELEEKSNVEKNLDKILKINESVCVVSDLGSDSMCKSSDPILSKISDDVTLLQERTEKILKIEDDYRPKELDQLGPIRAKRDSARQDCYNDVSMKLEKLSETLMEEELEIERKFLKFEQSLRNQTA